MRARNGGYNAMRPRIKAKNQASILHVHEENFNLKLEHVKGENEPKI